MIRQIKQWWCGKHRHPYPTITIPIVGQYPDGPDTDEVFCTHCSAHLYTEYTDNAGTERR